MSVKVKISSPDYYIFSAKIADFGLNYCILKGNARITLSGRSACFLGEDSPSCRISNGTST